MELLKLVDVRTQLQTKLEQLVDKVETEHRKLTDVEQTDFQKLKTSVKKLMTLKKRINALS